MKKLCLQEQLNGYLSLKESLGGIRSSDVVALKSFVDHMHNLAPHTVPAQHAIDWARGTEGARGASRQSALLSLARNFLMYAKATYPEIEIPDKYVLPKCRRPAAYIFSDDEVNRLLDAAGNLGQHHSMGSFRAMRPRTYYTFLGLLACTGLRTSEALNLLVSDVQINCSPPRLFIQESKFGKSRYVPLHSTAALELGNFLQSCVTVERSNECPFLFASKGKRLNYNTVYWTFQNLLVHAGIEGRRNLRRPTLHSLRHTFASSRLRAWYEAGMDVRSLLPHLSVYLGHVNIADTYWYLTVTPELLGSASQLFSKYYFQGGAQ